MVRQTLLHEAKAQSCMKLCGHKENYYMEHLQVSNDPSPHNGPPNFGHLTIFKTFTSINQVPNATIFDKTICCYFTSKYQNKKSAKGIACN
jgi:hypothetical protein